MNNLLSFYNNYIGIIITLLIIISRYFKKKEIRLAILIFSVPINLLYLFTTSDGWFKKIYAILLIFVAVTNILSLRKIKDETTVKIPDDLVDGCKDVTITIDNKEHFIKNYDLAQKGDPMGMYNVSCCYRSGMGTSVDFLSAYKWAKKLSSVQDPFWQKEGKKLLEELKQENKSNIKESIDDVIGMLDE